MIVVTGAYGFIGSCLVESLNRAGHRDIIVVDDFYQDGKEPNLEGKWIRDWIHRDIFLPWMRKAHRDVEVIFHLGARTDTASAQKRVFDKLNLNYSKAVWEICTQEAIPLIYASSAATYGDGSRGFSDEHDKTAGLEPLNLYAVSKHDFDLWALEQSEHPPQWAGLKFFNVFGPNEYHKGRMASVVLHVCKQISESGQMRLFRSHREDIADGHQKRDFVYVKDVVEVCLYFMQHGFESGLYNVGTGAARTFLDLTTAAFSAMGQSPEITFIDTPEDIRDSYQYYTQAEIGKLRTAGYTRAFTSLEKAVEEYVGDYLKPGVYY
jgi:ADP-L-glycero-D-manno-heptose 6-epimerase